MILKTPKALRVGMTGVRIPGHIGTWSIVEALSRVRGGEDVKLYVCHSETFGRACNVLYAGDTGRAYVILSNSDAASVAEREGYR